MTQFKKYVAVAKTEELEKEFGRVRAALKNNETDYFKALLKLCIIDKELCNREKTTGMKHN